VADDVSARKIAENDSRFRDANERIAGAAREQGFDDERRFPVLCECSDRQCMEIVLLDLASYRQVRANPRRFVHARGHEEQVEGAVEPLAEHDGYLIVEKIGEAGKLAEELADAEPQV
jgi:hypothetical protein